MLAEQILYEDNHLLAINKLAGQITQGDKTGDPALPDLIKAYIKERDGKPGNVFCGVIHRLDRPVSGAVVFAKTSKALSRMTQLVASRDFHKIYWAVVQNAPKETSGECVDWLIKRFSAAREKLRCSATERTYCSWFRFIVLPSVTSISDMCRLHKMPEINCSN